MGNICSGGDRPPLGSEDQRKASEKIDKELRIDRRRIANEVKLLLLGAGESGKSTIAKQMKILHLNGFTTEERNAFKPVIASNTVGSMRVLLSALDELDGIPPLSDDCFDAAKRVMDEEGEYFRGVITPQLAADLNKLWHNSSIRKAFDRSAEFQLNDSAGYYLSQIEDIGKPDYIPSVQDVLRSRTKTTGILEMNFVLQGVLFKMVDVGGQRSERKKWMHCFQDVTAVIFCVGMSEYDLRLYEDDSTNRMHESLKLFREICNTKWFASTAMILFFEQARLIPRENQANRSERLFPRV